MENTIKLLIVDDHKIFRDGLKLLLGQFPFIGEIGEASDGKEFLDRLESGFPDLVLMDIQLPGMDGLSATKIIKEDPDLKDIPIVALTSYAMQGDKEKALAAGCTGYIAKPIDTRKFLETISQYLNADDL